MIPLNDALDTTFANLPRPQPTRVPLADALGLVLAHDVAADVDMPPFNKSAMDGFAVLAADLADPPATLPVIEDVPAGAVPTRPVAPGLCSRIMTGAPVPNGADAVVRVEDTQPGPADGHVTFLKPIAQGMNVCIRAEDVARGDVVLRAGHVVRPPEIAILAACGYVEALVYRRPTVAVLSTGNELVPIDRVPEAGQIRDSNSHYVAARLRRLGIEARRLPIAIDEPRPLEQALEDGLQADILVVSGGVSMGDYDLVPPTLERLGVRILFDSVAMQPGRPTVLGRRGDALVFGLPGNPVSVLVAGELFLVPAIKAIMGYAQPHPPRRKATLLERSKHRVGRLAHLPGVLAETDGAWTVRPLPYHGSAHIHALSQADCLLVLPSDVAVAEATQVVDVVELRV